MQKMKVNKNKIEKNKRKVIATSVLIVFNMLLLSFAWYYYQTHLVFQSEEREVMPPYCLYLVDSNGTDALQLTIGNLHPGEKKQIVVGVSNKAVDGGNQDSFNIARDSMFNYELELAYTKNLPVDYKVYSLAEVEGTNQENALNDNLVVVELETGEGQPVSKVFTKTLLNKNAAESDKITDKNNNDMYGGSGVVNIGQYDVYDKTSNASFDLTTNVDETGKVNFDLDYYLIEINWQQGISFSDYLKETDLVYVMVKALQLEPIEETQ